MKSLASSLIISTLELNLLLHISSITVPKFAQINKVKADIEPKAKAKSIAQIPYYKNHISFNSFLHRKSNIYWSILQLQLP